MPERRVKLHANKVCLEYPGHTETDPPVIALDGIDLSIYEGEFVSIVGPSGCGKSTFASIVDGLALPTSGVLKVNGVEVQGPGPDRAMVFQDASLLPWRTVLNNVLYGLECRNGVNAAAVSRAKDLINLVGLAGFEHKYPHQLSGGMQQRVNLARALALEPDVLLMDEPFAALDAQTREIMQEELLRIWEETKKTVLFITHQIDEAVFLSDRVVVFSARPGRIREIVPIEMERPRSFNVKRSPAFHEHVDRIWSLIEVEVRQGLRDHIA